MKFIIPETSVTRAVEFFVNKRLLMISFIQDKNVQAAVTFSFVDKEFYFVRND